MKSRTCFTNNNAMNWAAPLPLSPNRPDFERSRVAKCHGYRECICVKKGPKKYALFKRVLANFNKLKLLPSPCNEGKDEQTLH